MPPTDRAPAEPRAWRVTLNDGTTADVELARGGVDVGAMNVEGVGGRAYLVISDAANRVVWMMLAERVVRVERCTDA